MPNCYKTKYVVAPSQVLIQQILGSLREEKTVINIFSSIKVFHWPNDIGIKRERKLIETLKLHWAEHFL